MDDLEARTRALDSADRLFAERGIKPIGMAEIRDASGVSLKRLYKLYASKEQLADEVLRRRSGAFLASLRGYVERWPSPEDQLLGVFDFLAEWFREPSYRGCPFINAFGEMSADSALVGDAVAQQKRDLRGFLSELVDEAGKPAGLADQLGMLADGAMVGAAILDGPLAAQEAKAAARVLIEQAG